MKKRLMLRFSEGGLILVVISVFAIETGFLTGEVVKQIDGGAE